MPKIKSTCGVSYLRTERPQLLVVAPLLSASVELSCFNLAAPRKGNPCVAYGHRLLRWPGDSGHGGKVPGSWHGQAAKPALGKRWQPAEQPCYKLSPILHKLLYGRASPTAQLSGSPATAGPALGYFTSQKFPRVAAPARSRQVWRSFHSAEPGRGHSSWTLK